jgi:predicted PurR-regulated permease PerM
VSSDFSQQKSLIRYAIFMTALTGIVLWAAYNVRHILLLLYISGLFAIGFSPMVRLIEKQRLSPVGRTRFPRWLAILVLYLFIISALVGVGMLVIPPIIEQSQQLWSMKDELFVRAQQFLIDRGILSEALTLEQLIARAPISRSGEAVGTIFGAVVGVIGGVFGFLTILIVTFYILIDANRLRDLMLHLFPRERRPAVAAASREIVGKVSAWLGGQLMLGTIIGVTTWIGLWIMGIPFFYVLALIAGIGEMIPIVGPILAAIPAVAVAATISFKKVLLVILFFVVQQQFENHVLVPKVMERQVGVSAIGVIVALLIGANLLGIVGAILAVPTAAILQVVLTEIAKQREG